LRERLERLDAFRSDLVSAEDFCREAEAVLEDAKTKNEEAARQVIYHHSFLF
jgi:hypothetical protein